MWLEQNSYHASIQPVHIATADVCMTPAEFAEAVDSPLREIAVLERGGELLAAALLVERRYENKFVIPRAVAFIHEICVAEKARRSTLGRTLMSYVESWAAARSLDSIELNVWALNSGARAFYGSLGFAELRLELAKPVA